MVSTRQMTITTGPGAVEDPFSDSSAGTLARNVSGATSRSANGDDIPKQRIYLLDLPIEILDKVFSYVGYKQCAQMRGVSQQMNQVCKGILNSTFQKLQTQLQNRFQNVKKIMPRRESARRSHPSAGECDLVETCHMRLSLLQMTFGKHIDRNHICFFPGSILDEVYNILNYIRTTPKLGRPYIIIEELFDLSTMAMEYFKEHLESTLPEIAYFNKDFLDFGKHSTTSTRKVSSSHSSSMPSPPQTNMVLRKGIRKIKQGMKRYNNQLTVLRNDLRFCKKKSTEQTKQLTEMQKLLAEQQKQTHEYAARLDESEKKYEEMSMKISTLLQEANKCKTELQYWRSKSPATTVSNSFGHLVAVTPENLPPIVDVKAEHLNLSAEIDKENPVQINENIVDLKIQNENDTILAAGPATLTQHSTADATAVDGKLNHTESDKRATDDETVAGASCPMGSPKVGDKRKMDDDLTVGSAVRSTNSNNGSSDIKKARRVQSKIRCQTKISNNKTRSK
ncbi:F-box only protein 28 isoform X2 [Bradysia coprophila]|uniref:F-box only protein 28 isoform X2 n=1 Tax=Bradysia coprophila TaxID=38358 RepID=UPI00187DA004|nr:F-box only protein 28 isoform X2 [Bradysia coprophila]XP_037040072.1 F-box only protein 28 isoform X2 [Bradysia coprophila]